MKSDLDAFMQSNSIDAILVMGPAQHNPAMVYLTGGGHITRADLVLKRGESAILFHEMMERDEAARTGLVTRPYSRYPWNELWQQAGRDQVQALALRYQRMFTDLGLTEGRVALYGTVEAGMVYAVLSAVEKLMPGLHFIGFARDPLLAEAMMTKDDSEIARIRRMGQITTSVVGRVADFLSSQPVRGDALLRPDGEYLTIGDVKKYINLWLAEGGAENPEGTIFAQGYDAGVPHSTGTDTAPLRLGQTIVFDIFPCEAQGGYFYDFTRTWCLGYAPDEAVQLYETVKSVYHQVVSELKLGEKFSKYQVRTCELFEADGHPTIQTNPDTESGYVHSLGHGLGLKVHEKPFSGAGSGETERLIPGTVFTIEPGLYYPNQNLGVRLEDTYLTHPDGTFEVLADFPLDLVIPVKP